MIRVALFCLPTRTAIAASLLVSALLRQPLPAIASPTGGPGNSPRIVFGNSNPSITLCDPSRASSSRHGEWFRGVSIEGVCGDVNLIFPDMILGQRTSRAAFNFSGSPGTTLAGVNWMMSEAVIYDDTTGELSIGGRWYSPRERGLAGFEFQAQASGTGVEVFVRSSGSASNVLLRFGARNPLGYRLVTEILGAEGYRVAYGGSPQNPEIVHIDGKGFKTQVLYKIADTRGVTQVIDKILVTPAGASYHLATFELTNAAGSNYMTKYQDVANGLSFSFEYTGGMNTISLPEAFAAHDSSDKTNGQVLRALSKVLAHEPSPSGGSIPVPRLNMQLFRDSETPTLISGGKEKFLATSELRVGALQLSNGTSLLTDHVKSDGSAPTEKAVSGFSNWSYKERQTLEYPQNRARVAQNFPTLESVSGSTLRYERNSVGAVTRVFRKLRGGREFAEVSIERDGYWVKSVSDFNRTRTVKTGSPIYPTSITTTDSLGRFSKYDFTYTTFKDPRASALTQTLLSRVAFTNSAGRKWSEQFFWDGDKLVGGRAADGIRVDRSDTALVVRSYAGAEIANYQIADSPVKSLVSQPDIFRVEQSTAGATTSSRAELAGGVISSSKMTSPQGVRPGLLSPNSLTGESTNAEGARNQMVAFANIGGATAQSTGGQGSFTSSVNTGLQQVNPSVSCSANGISTTGASCTRGIGVQAPKETSYGGGGLGIERVECLSKDPVSQQVKIGIWYTNAMESMSARATIQILGDTTRTILEGSRQEFTDIYKVGALICEGEFTPTKGEESRMLACWLPAGVLGGDNLVLFAGSSEPCTPVFDVAGNPSHCGAPVMRPPPSFTGIYSNWWKLDECVFGDEPVPDPVPWGRQGSGAPMLDASGGAISR